MHACMLHQHYAVSVSLPPLIAFCSEVSSLDWAGSALKLCWVVLSSVPQVRETDDVYMLLHAM
jgi:hypothetical protein